MLFLYAEKIRQTSCRSYIIIFVYFVLITKSVETLKDDAVGP